MDVVERIVSLLDKEGISPTKMMRDLGFSSGLFSQWKRGLQKPSRQKVKAIADYLEVSVDYLLGNETSAPAMPTDDDLKFALFNGTEGVTDEMFDEVKAFAQFVKEREAAKNKR